MTQPESPYFTSPLEPDDAGCDFGCGQHALDDYFARHALTNDRAGISRTYVLRRGQGTPAREPAVLGFYTLSMASLESADAARVTTSRLPRYPMPVALIGRLAVDRRVQGQRVGEKLLIDALRRVVDAADLLGCLGIIVDAKDEAAERFYSKYDFKEVHAASWPHRMFLPIRTARAAFSRK